MKRLLSAVLASSFLTGVLYAAPATAQDAYITRAGAIAVMVQADSSLKQRAEWYDTHMPPLPLFYDVEQEQWYAPYIEAAFEGGLLSGNDDPRLFRPGEYLTTEEAIAMVNRAKAHMAPATAASFIQTANNGTWVEHEIQLARAYGVTLPNDAEIGQPIPRIEFHAMLASIGMQGTSNIALTIRRNNDGTPVLPQPTTPTPNTSGGNTSRPVTSTTPPPAPTSAGSNSEATKYASKKFFSVTIPSASITDLTITHPADTSTQEGLLAVLQSGVGHLFSYPGKGGKILIYGHSSAYPWDVSNYTKIFRQINKLNKGDKIYVTYNGNLHVYEVTHESIVAASDTSAYRGAGEELILYTCWPPDDIKQRYLVHAKPLETIPLK